MDVDHGPSRRGSDTPGVAGAVARELVGEDGSLTMAAARVDRLARIARRRLEPTVGMAEQVVGHPIHPALTDLPIGFWTSATVLDLVGGRRSRVAARRLVALGVLSAVPAALTGLHDAGDREKGLDRRLVALHAACNGGATLAYALSWRARRREHWWRGTALGLVGATLATAGGALGGELAFPAGEAGEAEEAEGAAGPDLVAPDGAAGDRGRPRPESVGGGNPPDPLGGVDPATLD